jgi:hypothetical protein
MALLMRIMGVEFPDSKDDYQWLSSIPRSVLNAYRIALGESLLPQYRFWAEQDESSNSSRAMVSFIWLFWLFTQFSMLVFGLNFLIAQVQQILEQSMADSMLDRYTFRCKMIKENFALYEFFRLSHEMYIFRITADASSASILQQWSGFVQTLKVFIRGQNLMINEKMSKEMAGLEERMIDRHEELDDKIDKVTKKLEVINNNLDD